jgi:hypothetical protein
MKLSSFSSVAFAFVTVVASAAHADPEPTSVTCVSGQFGDHVESGRAAGDTAGIFNSKKAVYDVDIANSGAPTQVTLVWTLDGHEVQRQSLDVGTSPHWHTWGMRPIGNAKKVDVLVLDASGKSLKTDTVSGS